MDYARRDPGLGHLVRRARSSVAVAPTCTSTDPRNKRTRASAWVESDEGAHLLIDSGPEMRLQLLREGLTQVEAVLYTHLHADHTAGIDDLKAFNARLGGMLPCYGDAGTHASLRERFALRLRRHTVDRAHSAHRLYRWSTPRRFTSAARAFSRFRCVTARFDRPAIALATSLT